MVVSGFIGAKVSFSMVVHSGCLQNKVSEKHSTDRIFDQTYRGTNTVGEPVKDCCAHSAAAQEATTHFWNRLGIDREVGSTFQSEFV